MRTWVIKPERRARRGAAPDDLLCMEVKGEFPEDDMLVWIQHDGKWDACFAYHGLPSAEWFDEFEG